MRTVAHQLQQRMFILLVQRMFILLVYAMYAGSNGNRRLLPKKWYLHRPWSPSHGSRILRGAGCFDIVENEASGSEHKFGAFFSVLDPLQGTSG